MVFRLLSFPWFSTFCFEFCFLYLPKNVIKFLKELSNSCEAAFLQKITWMWCEELALESRKWRCHRFGRQSLDILRHHSWAQRRHQIRTNLIEKSEKVGKWQQLQHCLRNGSVSSFRKILSIKIYFCVPAIDIKFNEICKFLQISIFSTE